MKFTYFFFGLLAALALAAPLDVARSFNVSQLPDGLHTFNVSGISIKPESSIVRPGTDVEEIMDTLITKYSLENFMHRYNKKQPAIFQWPDERTIDLPYPAFNFREAAIRLAFGYMNYHHFHRFNTPVAKRKLDYHFQNDMKETCKRVRNFLSKQKCDNLMIKNWKWWKDASLSFYGDFSKWHPIKPLDSSSSEHPENSPEKPGLCPENLRKSPKKPWNNPWNERWCSALDKGGAWWRHY